jgi:hypothetical protein
MVIVIEVGTAQPENSGSVTVGPLNLTGVFQLTFEFPKESFNGMGTGITHYGLQYNGTAKINWTDQTLH